VDVAMPGKMDISLWGAESHPFRAQPTQVLTSQALLLKCPVPAEGQEDCPESLLSALHSSLTVPL
jgi:hypothetical protein